MNKKTISLLLLFIILVTVTVTYAVYNQYITDNNHSTDSSENIDEDTLTTEIDSTFLDENQGVEIGEMI